MPATYDLQPLTSSQGRISPPRASHGSTQVHGHKGTRAQGHKVPGGARGTPVSGSRLRRGGALLSTELCGPKAGSKQGGQGNSSWEAPGLWGCWGGEGQGMPRGWPEACWAGADRTQVHFHTLR